MHLSESPSSSLQRTEILCKICGDVAQGYHFGAYSCHACGAFFRRSVSNQQLYTCLRNQRCKVANGHNRGMCKSCRFARCINEGMNINVIVVKPSDEFRCFEADSVLRKILLASRGTYTNRYAAVLKLNGGNRSSVRLGVENPIARDTMIALMSEASVLKQYICDSGFSALGLTSKEILDFTRELFYPWICYQSAMATLRNSGHRRQIAFFVDESNICVNETAIRKYVESYDKFLDFELIVRYTEMHFNATLQQAARIAHIRPEEYETALLFQLFALKTASALFAHHRPAITRETSRLFNDLKNHYVHNHDNVATRLGNLVLILTDFEQSLKTANEFFTILKLNGFLIK
ncbi:hypothetical protein M3Y94_00021200 [Aphelenchoides besseyi]|nr:hypothetical protein M3Y94_00021200 [Aphelenchoides besseyi]KAI6217058.1 Nuclear receptor domain-containing protein [Aphelenchoides besseyi]